MPWTDLLIETDEKRTAYACAVREFVTTLQLQGEDGTILFHHPVWDHPDSSHDVVEVLAWLNAGMLREEHIPDLAIRLRNRKHFDFTLGCVAAYLYDSIADIGNVRSIAWHYHRRQQPVPLDVALLCGGRIRALDDGSLTVDIPSAQRRAARTEQEWRREFTTRETPAVEGAAIAGRVPWLRNGWSAIPTAPVDDNAAGWRDRAMNVMEHLARSPFTLVEADGRVLLFGLAGVELPADAALAEA